MIIITGGARGVGKFLFEKFTDRKETVSCTYNSTLPDPDKTEFFTKVDISKHSEVSNWIEKIKPEMTHLVLINNTGINYNSFAHKADINEWSKVIEVNLIGTFKVIHSILPIMREQGYGRIMNLSSVVAQMGIPSASAYAASKAGLWGLTRSIAVENARKGITINNLNLGYYNIGMIEQVPYEYQTILKEKIPLGKFGDPQQIFNTINYIIDNDYLNGTSIDINGGVF